MAKIIEVVANTNVFGTTSIKSEATSLRVWYERRRYGHFKATTWVTKTADSTGMKLDASNIEGALKKGLVPNLYGMSAKDALYILENNGINVRLQGIGSVKKQSIEAGTKFYKGSLITLILG